MCGGSGGDIATQQAQTSQKQESSYKPNAYPMFKGALGKLSQIAESPYTAITRGVAGIPQNVQDALASMQAAYGTISPHMTSAAGHFENAANPLTQSDIENYFNPYREEVMKNLNETFGQQHRDTVGKLQSQAGGVGANRVAVGESELARQQGLAAGQTYAQIYQNALQAAQNQQGIEQASAYGLGNLGTAQFNAALQAAQAQFGVGQWEQMTEQQKLDAIYNQQMQEFGFPFAQGSWYANLLGGLGGLMGGTTKGTATGTQTGTYNPADPSAWSQIAGAGMMGVGAASALGWQPFSSAPAPASTGATFPGIAMGQASGGRIKGYAEGGSPLGDPGYIPAPSMNTPPVPPPTINFMPMNPMQPPVSGQGGKGSNIGGDVASTAMKILPMLLAAQDGGRIEGYAQGGSPGWSSLINPDKGSWGAAAPFMGILPAAMASGKGYGPMAGGFANQLITNPFLRAGMNSPSPAGIGTMGMGMGGMGGIGMGGVGMTPYPMMGNQINSEPLNILKGIARGGEIKRDNGGGIRGYAYGGGPFVPGGPDPFADWIRQIQAQTHKPFPTGTSSVQAPNATPFDPDVAGNPPPQGIQGSPLSGTPVKDWTGPTIAPPPEEPMRFGPAPEGPNDTTDPTRNPGPYVPGISGQGGPASGYPNSAGADLGLPRDDNGMPPIQAQGSLQGTGSGRWADLMAQTAPAPPGSKGYFDRLAHNPLFLMGAGILGQSSPYFGPNVGRGIGQGVEAIKAFQQLDYQKQAQALQNVLEAGRLDLAEGQGKVTAADKLTDNIRQIRTQVALNQITPEMGQEAIEQMTREYQSSGMLGEDYHVPVASDTTRPAEMPDVTYPDGADKNYYVNKSAVPEDTNQFYRGIGPNGVKNASQASRKIMDEAELDNKAGTQLRKQLSDANHYLDTQGKTGFLTGGSFYNERVGTARLVNTIARMTGQDFSGLLEQTEKIGDAEALVKLQTYMGFSLARTLGTREAMQIIQAAMAAVTGGQLTPAGAKNILYGVSAEAVRATDRYDWLSDWRSRNMNQLVTGGDKVFDTKIGTPEKYSAITQKMKELDAWRTEKERTPEQLREMALAIKRQYGFDPTIVGYPSVE